MEECGTGRRSNRSAITDYGLPKYPIDGADYPPNRKFTVILVSTATGCPFRM